jgi:hypothetical protein
MQTQNSSGFKSFTTNASTINEGQRVKLISVGIVDVAGATDKAIGVATSTVAAGLPITIKLFNARHQRAGVPDRERRDCRHRHDGIAIDDLRSLHGFRRHH